MSKVPNELVGPVLLGVTTSLTAISQFMPHIADVRAHSPNDIEFVADVRMGEVAAGAFVLGFGAIASSLTGSMAPVYVTVVMTAGLIVLYETALRSIHLFEGGI